ncbi:MAG: right-handed parallel beta-helix repeat-containing protein [Candidatus Bathyarchaeia archaeon]
MFFGVVFVAVPSVKGGPAELHVGLGQPYATIQSAVDAAESGDTIVVHPGIYVETVDVTKSNITIGSLLGNPSDTIVDAGGADDHVFDITNQTGVTLTGFTVRNAKGATKDVAGISIYRSTNCKISNNVVTNMSAVGYNRALGIGFYNSSRCNISNNIVKYSNYGIYVDSYSGRNTFSNNYISNTSIGIYLAGYLELYIPGAGGNNFSNTYISNVSARGIHLGSPQNKFSNTHISNINSSFDEIYGIYLGGSSNEFFDTYISNVIAINGSAYGIRLGRYSGYNTFSSTQVFNIKAKDTAYGIYLYWFCITNNFTNTNIFNVTSASADAYGIYLAAEANWNNFLNTYIFNVNAGRDAYGVYKAQAIENNFYNTYILDIRADRYAYDIYPWDPRGLFSNTYAFNINGTIQRLIPWIGLGLLSTIVIAAVIAIRRRRRKLPPKIQKGNTSPVA